MDRVRVAFAEALGRGRPDLYEAPQHNTQWSSPLSDLQAQTHDLAARGLGMARDGTYPPPDAQDWTAQVFSSRRVVTTVPREMDRLYTQLATPSGTFIRGPPGDDQALQAWAQLLTEGAVPTKRLRFAASMRMAPSTHTSAHAEFHYGYCSQPRKGWGDRMVHSCPVVLVAAMSGFRAMCALLQAQGKCRVKARFPGGHDVQQGRPRHALAAGVGPGRGRAV